MTPEQQRLADLNTDIDIAAGATRRADDAAQGKLHAALDPELRGHISIALQHLWMAQEMLAHMEARGLSLAEDMTYEPVTDVTTLAARVAELETALREQCELAATLMQQRTELEARLNATGFALANSALIQRVRELEAQLNAAIVGGAQLERENAELRARLGAIGDSREQLADVQHTIWAHWMNYMFTQGTWSDGTWTMPADKSQRWSRQMATPYSALTFEEQESDRHQADKVLAVLMQAVQP